MMKLGEFKSMNNYLTEIRRELHEHPGIGFDLDETLAIVRRELDAIGVEYTEKYGKSSIVATVNPEKTSFTVAIRADMDALPLTEDTGVEYASKNEGKMHACGHDAHTAILLGTVRRIYAMRDQIDCRVKFIFQAAEEAGTSGARLMALDGVMDDVDCIAALHCEPSVPAGKIAVMNGYRNADSNGFWLNFHGLTAHAARKKEGIDAIAMAVHAHAKISEYTDAEIAGGEPMVFNIGQIKGGETNNIVCDMCSMYCTLRTWNDGASDRVIGRIRELCEESARAFGGSFEFVKGKYYPKVYNDPRIMALIDECAREKFGDDAVVADWRGMGGEDFSYFANIKPGAMFKLGTRNEERGIVYGLHNVKFNIDETAMPIGVDVFTSFIIKMAERKSL